MNELGEKLYFFVELEKKSLEGSVRMKVGGEDIEMKWESCKNNWFSLRKREKLISEWKCQSSFWKEFWNKNSVRVGLDFFLFFIPLLKQ